MTYNALLPPPDVFGLPSQFDEWRPNQDRAALAVFESEKTAIAAVAPTGFGKSPMAIAIAQMLKAVNPDSRAAYLTETKGLQAQLMTDFESIGLVDVRGQGNYECRKILEDESRSERCDSGPCHAGVDCALRAVGCTYYDAFRRAKHSELVLTNYDYWLNVHRSVAMAEGGLGDFDLLILDEAHSAPDKVCDYLATEVKAEVVEGVLNSRLPPRDTDLPGWGDWAVKHKHMAVQRHDALATHAKYHRLSFDERRDLKLLRGLVTQLSTVTMAAGDASNWIVDRSRGNDARFDPIWPAPYLGQLTQGIGKVLLLSATIRPKTLDLLGFERGDTEFLEYPSSFPVERRPITFVPTIAMKYPFTEDKNRAMLKRIDQIIARRRDVKGFIPTVSYERAKYIYEHSEHRDIMMLPDSKTTLTTAQRFKDHDGGAVLLGPSYGTGYDFPHDECRYIIVPKLPFPNTTSLIMKARCDSDEEYRNYITMQDLQQYFGRGMRAADDWCEGFIIDDQWAWFRWKAAKHAAKWFREACRESVYIPMPLKVAA